MTATGTGVAATASTLVSQVKFYASAALALARITLAFNGVCAEGAFAYGGANYKGRFVGYLGEVDSQHGASSNILVEREEYNAGVAAGGGGTEPLVFVPLAEYAGGLVGLSRSGVSFGGYGGTPETFPVSAGAGAYDTSSWSGHCKH
jgi:hypothetical protein